MTAGHVVRLPAYAKPLVEMRRARLVPSMRCVTVRLDTWPPKDRPQCVAVPSVTVPPSADVRAIDAHFLEGLDVQVAYWPSLTTRERLDDLLRTIVSARPRRLWWLNMEDPDGFHFVLSVKRGLEAEL